MKPYSVTHPCKTEIIEALARLGEASPREIADGSKFTLGTVSYHVRDLQGAGVLRLRGTEQVRGAIKHIYALDRRRLTTIRADLLVLGEQLQATLDAVDSALDGGKAT